MRRTSNHNLLVDLLPFSLVKDAVKNRRSCRRSAGPTPKAHDGPGKQTKNAVINVVTITAFVCLVADVVMTFDWPSAYDDAVKLSKMFHTFRVTPDEVIRRPKAYFLWLIVTVTCSYPVLFYIILHATYRETFKEMAKDWYRFLTRSKDRKTAYTVTDESNIPRVVSTDV